MKKQEIDTIKRINFNSSWNNGIYENKKRLLKRIRELRKQDIMSNTEAYILGEFYALYYGPKDKDRCKNKTMAEITRELNEQEGYGYSRYKTELIKEQAMRKIQKIDFLIPLSKKDYTYI